MRTAAQRTMLDDLSKASRSPWILFSRMLDRGAYGLVGQAPNQATRDDEVPRPLTGSVGIRLSRLAGVEWPGEYLRTFARTNCLDFYPGPNGGHGDAFPLEDARAGARRIVEIARLAGGGSLVLLGWNVASAFDPGARKLEFFEWYPLTYATDGESTVDFAITPHPSGVNRWWNREDNRRRAEEFFCAAAKGSSECMMRRREDRETTS